MSEPSNALVVIEQSNIQAVFTADGAINPILEKIASEARSFVADTSTATGRKNIASIAMRVAKSKTYLDGLGKELVDGLKELPKKVDANRKQIRDFLDALKDEVRQPLTEWEAAEEKKKADELERVKAELLAKEVANAHEFAVLMNAEFDRQKDEERKAAEQAKKDAEERIAKEAAERATRESEAKAQAEREAAAQREINARLATERAEREKAEAEQRAKDAEARAEKLKQEASEREEQARIEATQREIKRREAEEQKAREDQQAREADKEHRRKVNSETVSDLQLFGFYESTAKAIVTAIAQGKVRHVAINY